MTSGRKFRLLLAIGAALAAPAALAQYTFGAPQATELWGGPAAKGVGASGSRYDTNVTITAALAAATGTVDFWAGGSLKATVPFSVNALGVDVIPAPDALDGAGPFLYHVVSSVAVMAYSQTYNDTPNGRYGVSVPAFTTADLLSAGDQAAGGGLEDSTDPQRSRSNIGVLCSPTSGATCQIEVTAYSSGSLLGLGTLSAAPGSAAQSSLTGLVAAASGMTAVSVQIRMLSGTGAPYAIVNDNRTSDGTLVPLAITRAAFSTAPTISSFTVSPATGCSPLPVTLTWSTTGAAKVNISGVSGDLPPNGTTTTTLLTSTDLVLTATSSTGASSNMPQHVTVSAPTESPTPTPDSAQLGIGASFQGSLPLAPVGTITATFTQQQSTGSTFTVGNGTFTYVAGSTAGTDIVQLTATGPCGPVTATFTATVLPPGAPQITSFTSIPAVGCAPANITLTWTTVDAVSVAISNIPFLLAPNGSFYDTISTTTTYQLTARGANGQSSKTTLTVPVDTGLPPVPVLSPNSQTVSAGTSLQVTVSNVANPNLLRIVTIQNQSHGTFQYTGGSHFTYTAGPIAGTTDIFRVFTSNGCGYIYATFTGQVN